MLHSSRVSVRGHNVCIRCTIIDISMRERRSDYLAAGGAMESAVSLGNLTRSKHISVTLIECCNTSNLHIRHNSEGLRKHSRDNHLSSEDEHIPRYIKTSDRMYTHSSMPGIYATTFHMYTRAKIQIQQNLRLQHYIEHYAAPL